MKKLLFFFILLLAVTGCANTPVNFKVERVSTTSVKLNWDKSEWASGYKVYRSDSEDGMYREVNTTENVSYEDMGLRSGAKYYYKVSAIGFGGGKESVPTDKVTASTELLVPSNLRVSASNSKVFLDWYSVKEAALYRVYRSETEKGEYKVIGETNVNSYEDTSMESGKNYFYKIKAIKGDAESAFSYLVSIKSGMGAPKNISAIPNGVNGVLVTWDRVEGAASYYIYRSRNENASFDEIGFTDANRYEDKNLISGRIYYYKVKAAGKGVESQMSESAFAMTKVAAPKNIRIKQVTQETATFMWDSVDLVDGYKIYRSDNDNKNYKELDYTSELSFTDKGLEPNTIYYYKITAYVGKTESDYSEEKRIETNAQVITLKIIKSGMSDIRIGWTKLQGVTNYTVYRSEKASEDYEQIGTTDENTFDDSGLSPYKNYYYRVKGFKGTQEINSTILVVKSIDEDKKEPAVKNEGSKKYITNCITANNSANLLAAGTTENNIKLWKISTGELLATLTGHSKDVVSIAFSPDGTILASGDGAGIVKIWGMPDGELLKTIKAHSDKVSGLAVGIDNKTLVTGGSDRLVKVWSITEGKETRIFKGHESAVTGVVLFSDNNRVASSSNDKTIKLWNIETGKLARTFVDKYMVSGKELENYNVGEVTSLSIDAAGKRLASGNADNKVKVWDASTGELLATLRGHMDIVSDVIFNKYGNKIASVSWDKTIKIWDISSPTPSKWVETTRSEYLNGHAGFITGIDAGSEGNMIYTSSKDGTLKMWDINTGKVIRTFVEK